jgi:hypothetical protein
MSTTSQWAGVLEKDPCEALAASLAVAYPAHFEFLIIGDLNARISALALHPVPPWTRETLPNVADGYANCLMNITQSSSAVLNALGPIAVNLPPSNIRKTVIDYTACSRNLFSSIKTFSVADRIPGYDHAHLLVSFEVQIDAQTTIIPNPRKGAGSKLHYQTIRTSSWASSSSKH